MSVIVNFHQLDEWGINDEINNLLASLGLKLIISEDGYALGCAISPELYYTKNNEKNNKFQNFVKNRYYNLTTRYNKKYVINKQYKQNEWGDPPK